MMTTYFGPHAPTTHPKICDSYFQGNTDCGIVRIARENRCGGGQRVMYVDYSWKPRSGYPLDFLCSANRSSHITQFYL